MAEEKKLSTRIVLRNDVQSNWDASTKPLLKGELGISYVENGNAEIRFGATDGEKVFNEAVKLQISADQVVGLSDYVKEADLTTWKNETGLSAAAADADHQVVLWKDVKDITSAMRFRGAVTPEEGESDKEAIARVVTEPKAGDFVIITTNSKEYVYTVTEVEGEAVGEWREIGDEGTYCTKADFETFKGNVELSVATLDEALTAETTARETADSELSTAIDNEASARETADDEIKALIAAETTAREGAVSDLQTAIDNEVSARETADSALSTVIDNKIVVDGVALSGDAKLKLDHVSQDEYHQMVVEGTLDPYTVYAISSDNLNMYDQQIKNLADATDDQDAVTYKQLKAVAGEALSGIALNGLDFAIANNKATLTVDIIDCGGAD